MAAFERLVSERCDRNQLANYLMEIHATRDWKPVCKRDAEAALGHIRKAESSIKKLSDTDLRLFLGELEGDRSFRLENVATILEKLGLALEKVIPRTTERESIGQVLLLIHLVRFVRWSTGFWRDEDVDAILGLVLRDGAWSTFRWRRDHKQYLRKKKPKTGWDARWDAELAEGKLQRSLVLRKRRPRRQPLLVVRNVRA
jgi:hypothetical protein